MTPHNLNAYADKWPEYTGLVENMPAEQYHGAPGLSASLLGLLHPDGEVEANPAAFAFACCQPKSQSGAMARGTVLHHLLEGGAGVPDGFAVRPEGLDLRTAVTPSEML